MITTQSMTVRYIGATNYQPSKVKIIDTKFNKFVKLSFDYETGNVLAQAQQYLEEQGYICISCASHDTEYTIHVDTATNAFKPLEEV